MYASRLSSPSPAGPPCPKLWQQLRIGSAASFAPLIHPHPPPAHRPATTSAPSQAPQPVSQLAHPGVADQRIYSPSQVALAFRWALGHPSCPPQPPSLFPYPFSPFSYPWLSYHHHSQHLVSYVFSSPCHHHRSLS